MTIQVEIKNKNQGGEHNIRVHKCYMTADGLHAEDGVIIGPGASVEFIIWKDVKLAIEEEYDVPPAYDFERDGEIEH
jgi:hypothetical protein